MAGDAEAARSHLLDGTVLPITIGQALVAIRVLAAFASVALATHAVHRDGKRFVRFLADRTIRHRSGLEAPDDSLDRLHLLDGYPLGGLELQQPAQRRQLRRLIVDESRV